MSNGHNSENNSGADKHHEDNNRDGDKHDHDDDHGDDHDDDCTPVIIYTPGPDVPGPTVHEHHHHEIVNHIEVIETVIEYVEVEVEVPVYIQVEVPVTVEVPVPGPTEYVEVEVPGPAGSTVYIEVEVPGPSIEGGWDIIDTGQHNNQVPVPDANEGLPLDVVGSTVVATGVAWTVAKFLGKKLLARAGDEAKDVKEALL